MSYVGRWIFHSIGIFDDSGKTVYMTADEYMNMPTPSYIDESDADAVENEKKERAQMVGGQLEVGADGKMRMLMPLPEGVSEKELDEAVRAGEISLVDGMISVGAVSWEERDGELWYESDMNESGWEKASDGEYLAMFTARYIKAD